jgi:hypothetical protein
VDERDALAELVGRGVAHRVGDVDGAGAGLDGGLDGLVEELGLGAARVLGAELDVGAEAAREAPSR